MRILWRCLLALAVVWSLITVAVTLVQRARPTPQKFMAYVTEHPLQGLAPAGRTRVIERAAQLLNGLSFEQRQELKETGALRNFFKELSSGERLRFIQLTVPAGFHEMIKWLNQMEPTARQRLAARTLRNLREHSSEAGVIGGDDEIRRMMLEGYSTFTKEADAQVKLDFKPLIEELQKMPHDKLEPGK